MRQSLVFVLAVFMAAASASSAQADQEAEKALRAELGDKAWFLRDFNGADKVHWSWKDGTWIQADPPFRALTGIKVSAVKIHRGFLELHGTRVWLLLDPKHPALVDLGEDIAEVIDLPQTAPADSAQSLPRAIFYDSAASAVSDFRTRYKDVEDSMNALALKDPAATSARQSSETGVCNADQGKPKPPVLLRQVDPDVSSESLHGATSDAVRINFKIGVDGHASDFWVIGPSAYGESQALIAAVSQDRFKPMMCGTQPKETRLSLYLNYARR